LPYKIVRGACRIKPCAGNIREYQDGLCGNVLPAGGKNAPQKSEKSREKTREKILELVTGNPSITAQEFADSVGLSVKGIEKAIRVLKEQGLLKRVGPDKGGHRDALARS